MTTPSGNSFREAQGRVAPAEADVDLPVVLRARQGDKAATAALWNKYRRTIFHFFAQRIAGAEEAEDLASDTLCAALSNLDAFRGQSASPSTPSTEASTSSSPPLRCTFRTYLFTIAQYQLRQWIRLKKTRPQLSLTDLSLAPSPDECPEAEADILFESLEPDPLESVLRQEHLDSACHALAEVGLRSGEQFKALLFHTMCGLPHKEVAQLLGTRPETINTRLQEARKTLRKHHRDRVTE